MIGAAFQFLANSSALKVTDVGILRDGGTIIFGIETDDRQRLDFSLASPFHGEPRLLSVGVSEYSDQNLRTTSRFAFQPGGKMESQLLGILRRWLSKQDSPSKESRLDLIASVVENLSTREGTNDSPDDLSEIASLKIRVALVQMR